MQSDGSSTECQSDGWYSQDPQAADALYLWCDTNTPLHNDTMYTLLTYLGIILAVCAYHS